MTTVAKEAKEDTSLTVDTAGGAKTTFAGLAGMEIQLYLLL